MTAMPVTERMTADEYLARPEDPRERGWELISGELIDMRLVDIAGDTVFVFRRSQPDGPELDIALELTRDDTLTSPQLPGFSLRLGPVFGE